MYGTTKSMRDRVDTALMASAASALVAAVVVSIDVNEERLERARGGTYVCVDLAERRRHPVARGGGHGTLANAEECRMYVPKDIM